MNLLRNLIGDAQGQTTEVLTVPIHYLLTPQPSERAGDSRWKKKILLSLTPVRLCDVTEEEEERALSRHVHIPLDSRVSILLHVPMEIGTLTK